MKNKDKGVFFFYKALGKEDCYDEANKNTVRTQDCANFNSG